MAKPKKPAQKRKPAHFQDRLDDFNIEVEDGGGIRISMIDSSYRPIATALVDPLGVSLLIQTLEKALKNHRKIYGDE